jgi:hypothetical protein
MYKETGTRFSMWHIFISSFMKPPEKGTNEHCNAWRNRSGSTFFVEVQNIEKMPKKYRKYRKYRKMLPLQNFFTPS